MKPRTIIALIVLGLAILVLVAFCAARGGDSSAQQQAPVTQQDDDDDDATTVFGVADDDDKPDCDAEDRRKNEVPDCGFRHNGRFVAWSWVAKGKKTPPHGWRGSREQAAYVAAQQPPATRRAVTPAPTRPAATPPPVGRTTPPAARPAAPAPIVTRATTRSTSGGSRPIVRSTRHR